MVIFDPDVYPMDRAWLTGKTSADHLRHTRPAYYSHLVSEQCLPAQPEQESLPTQHAATNPSAEPMIEKNQRETSGC